MLQGKNTTGGSIVITRIRPKFNEVSWAVSTQVGNFNEMQFKGRVNIPLVDDTLALKLGYISKERDGYFDNLTRGGSAGDIDYQAITAALRWEPTDNFDALLTYDYIKDRGDIPPQDPRYNGHNPYKNEANFDEYQTYDVDGLTLSMNWDLGFGVLSSVTGWQQADDVVGQDFDGTTRFTITNPLPQLHTLRDQEYEQFSEELKLVGNLSDTLRYVVGGFYWETDHTHAQGTNIIVQIPNPVGAFLPCSLIVPTWIDNPNPAIGSAFCQLPQVFSDQHSAEKTQSVAVFGALTWDVTDRIELSAGVRWLDEEKDFTTQFGTRLPPAGPVDALGDPINPPTDIATVFPGFPVSNSKSWDDVVFTVSSKWDISNNSQVYASYSQGFRSGGNSMRGTDPARITYEPENVDSFEIGTKNDLLDGRLRINLAAFVTVQEARTFSSILTIASLPGTNTLILNSSEDYDIKGFEAEVIWAATDSLSFIGTLGIQDAEGNGDTHSCLDRPFNPNGFACNPIDNPELFAPGAGPLPNVVVEGGATGGQTPDYNWALAAFYDRQFGGNEFHAGVIVRRTDEVALSADTSGQQVWQPAFNLIDAQISYRWNLNNGDSVKLAFYGKNLNDEEYVEQELFLGEQGGFTGWGPPATYALELQWTH